MVKQIVPLLTEYLSPLVPTLLLTLLISKLIIWLLRKIWIVNFTIVFLANVASLLICGAFVWYTTNHSFLASLLRNAPFQAIWLGVDVILQIIRAVKEFITERKNENVR